MNKIITLLCIVFLSTQSFSQQDSIAKTAIKTISQKNKKTTPFETGGSVKEIFDYVYKSSTSFKGRTSQKVYKSINQQTFLKLQKYVLDSLQEQKKNITAKAAMVDELEQKNQNIINQLKKTEEKLSIALSKKESRSFLGVETNKGNFTTILIATYSFLIILLAVFIFKFSKNNTTTKKALEDLKDLETEFEKHKKSSLQRFQEVNRKLQDELNKKWKSGEN